MKIGETREKTRDGAGDFGPADDQLLQMCELCDCFGDLAEEVGHFVKTEECEVFEIGDGGGDCAVEVLVDGYVKVDDVAGRGVASDAGPVAAGEEIGP